MAEPAVGIIMGSRSDWGVMGERRASFLTRWVCLMKPRLSPHIAHLIDFLTTRGQRESVVSRPSLQVLAVRHICLAWRLQ
jgi:hypothetical protein